MSALSSGQSLLARRLTGAVAALLLFIPAAHAKNPYGIPDDVDAGLRQGFQDLFNLDFDKADAEIQALQGHASAHPMVALAAAVVPWWKLTVGVLERDSEASKPFETAGARCLAISQRRLQQDRLGEASVAMGTMLGLMSRWSAANRAWLAAYSRGNKSVAHLNAALKQNPGAADAYMTLGTFNYARALLNKWMGGKSVSGEDKAQVQGLQQLRRAYAEAPYFRQASGVLLAGILANEEPAAAVTVLRQLRVELPRSAFVHMVLVTALYNAGASVDLETEADALEKNVDKGIYQKSFAPQANFAQALVLFRKAKWRPAAKAFGEAVESGTEANPYTTWAILYQGYCYDASGHRDKAVENYRRVLALKPRFASHERAREHIDKPFTREAPELRKLEL